MIELQAIADNGTPTNLPRRQLSVPAALYRVLGFDLTANSDVCCWGAVGDVQPRVVVRSKVGATTDTSVYEGPEAEMQALFALIHFHLKHRSTLSEDYRVMMGRTYHLVYNNPLFSPEGCQIAKDKPTWMSIITLAAGLLPDDHEWRAIDTLKRAEDLAALLELKMIDYPLLKIDRILYDAGGP